MQKHKWYNEIVAWANGAEIQFKDSNDTNEWFDTKEPTWEILDFLEYRIKPQEQQSGCCCKQTCSAPKEPQYLYVYGWDNDIKISKELFGTFHGLPYIGKIKLEQ